MRLVSSLAACLALALVGACDTGRTFRKTGPIGAACDRNADCDEELFCLSARGVAIAAGGPPGGYCTRSCTNNPAICNRFGADTGCYLTPDGTSFCFRGCESGSPRDSKCLGRDDVACSLLSLDPLIRACVPMCNTNADCPGRFCNPQTGVCTDQPRVGAPDGVACDASLDGDPNFCQGLCFSVNAGPLGGVCAGSCTVGVPECGVNGICLPDPISGDGDSGACFPRCDCATPCAPPLVCEQLGPSSGRCIDPAIASQVLACG